MKIDGFELFLFSHLASYRNNLLKEVSVYIKLSFKRIGYTLGTLTKTHVALIDNSPEDLFHLR